MLQREFFVRELEREWGLIESEEKKVSVYVVLDCFILMLKTC